MRAPALLMLCALAAFVAEASEGRATSDFEIAAMNRQLETSRDAFSRIAAHMNLGDLQAGRGNQTAARSHYETARTLAEEEMGSARKSSALRRYARAASWAGLSAAKLGRGGEAHRLLEEALRYDSDSTGSWNVYASAMTVLEKHTHSVAAARNAVTIASRSAGDSVPDALDLNIYRYALASALSRTETASAGSEAETLLGQIVLALSDRQFDSLRRKVARDEQFEIFSSTRTDSSAYLSLLNRTRLRLAKIYEESGRAEDARLQYRAVLADRIDDPAALAGMARLASGDEQHRYFAESFDASPFSLALVRQYESFLSEREVSPSTRRGNGATVQRAIEEASRNRHQNALDLLQTLEASHPDNSTLRYLIIRSHINSAEFARAREQLERRGLPAEIAGELRKDLALAEKAASRVPSFFNVARTNEPLRLSPDDLSLLVARIRTGTLTPEQLALVDTLHFVAPVAFEDVTSRDAETTTFQAGSLYDQRFRFSSPATFTGRFEAGTPHELEFQILGISETDGRETLLLQPWRVSS